MSIKGLEKITDKIIADAAAEAERIRSDAKARCEQISAEYRDRAVKRREEMTEIIQREATSQVTRAKSSAEMQKRNLLLAAKSDLVDGVFRGAWDAMKGLSDEAYTALLAGILSAALLEQLETERSSMALNGEDAVEIPEKYEVLLNQNDRTRCGEALITSVCRKLAPKASKEALGRLVLSPKTVPIDGGVILRCGDVEINGSFELLFAQLRSELETEVSSALFSGKTQI